MIEGLLIFIAGFVCGVLYALGGYWFIYLRKRKIADHSERQYERGAAP